MKEKIALAAVAITFIGFPIMIDSIFRKDRNEEME